MTRAATPSSSAARPSTRPRRCGPTVPADAARGPRRGSSNASSQPPDEPRLDDDAVVVDLGDAREVERVVRGAQHGEPLGDRLHHPVLDAVVDHLHEVARAVALEVAVAARHARGRATAARAARSLARRRRSSGTRRCARPPDRPSRRTSRKRDARPPRAAAAAARRVACRSELPPSMTMSPGSSSAASPPSPNSASSTAAPGGQHQPHDPRRLERRDELRRACDAGVEPLGRQRLGHRRSCRFQPTTRQPCSSRFRAMPAAHLAEPDDADLVALAGRGRAAARRARAAARTGSSVVRRVRLERHRARRAHACDDRVDELPHRPDLGGGDEQRLVAARWRRTSSCAYSSTYWRLLLLLVQEEVEVALLELALEARALREELMRMRLRRLEREDHAVARSALRRRTGRAAGA